jgi:hypothetical protein
MDEQYIRKIDLILEMINVESEKKLKQLIAKFFINRNPFDYFEDVIDVYEVKIKIENIGKLFYGGKPITVKDIIYLVMESVFQETKEIYFKKEVFEVFRKIRDKDKIEDISK